MSNLDDKVEKLEGRVNLLQNLAWVLSAIAIFLGVGGASLWNSLDNMRTKADHLSRRVNEYQTQVELARSNLDRAVASALDPQLKAALTRLNDKEKQSLDRLNALVSSDRTGFVRIGDIQICWGGMQAVLPSQKDQQHTRSYSFRFPREFIEAPDVADSVATRLCYIQTPPSSGFVRRLFG